MQYKAIDKYRSVIRAYKRLEKISNDNDGTISTVGAQDEVEDFFNQCYHLKDWLKKDSSLTFTQDPEDYINSSSSLSIAADICNSMKHAGLDKKPRSGNKIIEIKRRLNLLVPKGDKFLTFARHELTIGGKTYDAFELATDCLKAWEDYFKNNNIFSD